MRRVKTLILTVFGILGVAVMVAASAAAQGLPTLSPSATTNSTDGISIGSPTYEIENGNKVVCESTSTGTSTEDSAPVALGRFHFHFLGCVGEVSGIKAKCQGLGEANNGEILVLGEWHLVYDTGGTELGVAIVFLAETFHFTCAGLFLNIVEGEQVCLIKEPYVAKTLHEMLCIKAAGKGLQSETWLNDSGAVVTPKLKVSEGEAAAKGAAEEAKALLLHLNAKKENVSTVAVMN